MLVLKPACSPTGWPWLLVLLVLKNKYYAPAAQYELLVLLVLKLPNGDSRLFRPLSFACFEAEQEEEENRESVLLVLLVLKLTLLEYRLPHLLVLLVLKISIAP